MRNLQIGAAALAGVIGVIVPLEAANAGVDVQIVNAVTTQPRPTDVQVQLNVRQDAGLQEVANNLAMARSVQCNGCRTIAISIEVDLVSGTPRATLGMNRAVATDLNTQNSQTLADAVQFVVATGGNNVALTSAGSSALNAIRTSLIQLANSSTPASDVQSDLDNSVVPQVESILSSDVTSSFSQTPSVAEGGQGQEHG